MLYTNGFAFFAVLSGIMYMGELERAPDSLPWMQLVLYGSCSWVGVCCFIGLTRQFGATAAVVATNARKLLSVALSFVLFPKPFSFGFAVSGLACIAGVCVHQKGKTARKAAEKAATEGGADGAILSSETKKRA